MFASSRICLLPSRHPSHLPRVQLILCRHSQQLWLRSNNHKLPPTYIGYSAPYLPPSSCSFSSSSISHSSSTSSSPHTSLSTFLTHARATSLSPTSTVYIGTRYEYLAQNALASLGFQLTRSGGRSDGGIDLHGTWNLPASAQQPLRCIVQCKALTKKVGPNLVRELEGAFAAAPSLPGWRADTDVIGVLCATREATKGVREAIRRSDRGIVWVMLQDGDGQSDGSTAGTDFDTDSVPSGRIRQVLWNERVAHLGATGVGVGIVYGQPRDNGEVSQEVRLMWKGEIWEPEPNLEERQPH